MTQTRRDAEAPPHAASEALREKGSENVGVGREQGEKEDVSGSRRGVCSEHSNGPKMLPSKPQVHVPGDVATGLEVAG